MPSREMLEDGRWEAGSCTLPCTFSLTVALNPICCLSSEKELRRNVHNYTQNINVLPGDLQLQHIHHTGTVLRSIFI